MMRKIFLATGFVALGQSELSKIGLRICFSYQAYEIRTVFLYIPVPQLFPYGVLVLVYCTPFVENLNVVCEWMLYRDKPQFI